MITKHIDMHAANKSSFGRLVRYLTDAQGKEVRIGEVRISNCMNDVAEVAALEVLNTQSMNTRSRADKTWHLLVSFRAGEHPDAATLAGIEERLCDGLGFAGHQRVSVVHDDTDNLHLHIAVNKIHPTRYTIHEPFQAYRILAKLCGKLEDEYGLQKDNHTPRQVASENRAADMEHHAGIESLLGWVKRECKDRMQGAQSWELLHAVLAENGLRLHPHGNGLVITAVDGTTVKASSVAREFSKPRLEQRLGPYQEPEQQPKPEPKRRYEKKPLASNVDTTELYARYRAVQAAAAESQARERAQAHARKERRIEAAKRSVQLKRAALKLASMPGPAKKLMYCVLSRARAEEISAIKNLYRTERQAIDRKHRRCQWSDWLRREAGSGDLEAQAALRGRNQSSTLMGDSVAGEALPQRSARPTGHDSITKKGTIIYRVGDSVIRDDGGKLAVSLGADQSAMQSALRMAIARYGERITVNGSEAFKEQILMAAVTANLRVAFADTALERRHLELVHESATEQEADAMRARPGSGREAQRERAPTGTTAGIQHGNEAGAGDDSACDAAGRYIAEREQKRINGFDIPKHARYTPFHAGAASYAGTRRVDGQALVLLRQREQVMVLEIDEAAARRLKRLPLGARVDVSAKGVVKAKGRSR